MIYHIIPINDLKEHEESSTGECNPKLLDEGDLDGNMIIIHNSYDGREIIEQVNEIINGKRN